MLVSVLASGSEGNSTLIKTTNHTILVDIGMNLKYITEKLQEHKIDPSEIDYIFITHVHKDHVGALKTFIKKYKPILCMGKNMFLELDYLEDYPKVDIIFDTYDLDTLHIDILKTSHDTTDSRGYIFTENNSSVVYLTDTGYVNARYFEKLKNKNLYIWESNHDVEMLLHGKYPKWIQQRILSDKGHLSNQASSFYLSKLIGPNTQKVILAHISHENNTPELAMDTLKQTLKDNNIKFENITYAKQRESTEEVKI